MMVAVSATIQIGLTARDWQAAAPEVILGLGVLLMLLLDVFVPRRRLQILTGVTLLTLIASFAASILLWQNGQPLAMHNMIASDRFSMFFNYVILAAAFLAVLLSPSYIARSSFDEGEYYALVLAATAGMMLVAAAINFMIVFLGIELLSLSLYILSGFERTRERSQEAGFKYFLLSSFASAFLVYGMALIYGATGTTEIHLINICLHQIGCAPGAASSPLLFIGIGLLIVGLAFKVSVVPFHMWTPDVYEGAPTPVTAFMSVATKAAVFATFVRIFNLALDPVHSHWFGIIWALAVATMILGNLVALVQTNMKRLLAYSGIAHAGYILVALLANDSAGMTAIAFYFLAYTFMNIGAFIIVIVLENRGEAGDEISTYRGLWYRNPALAGVTAVFMFSLAGFPGTAGFVAKYLAFRAIVGAGHTELAIIGVLTSLVSIFYYLRVVYVMFTPAEQPAAAAEESEEGFISFGSEFALMVSVAGTIALGIVPTGFFNLATQSVTAVRTIFNLP